MIPLDEVRAYVRADLAPLAPVELPVARALGCVVAEAVVAREPSPSFANSAMDGYALRAGDCASVPTDLRVVGAVLAGDTRAMRVGPGEAARIMTGALVPEGADSVCPIEETETLDEGRSVRIARLVAVGEFVRRPGEDVVVGQVLVAPGRRLTPELVGVLSGQGIASVRVHPRPRVGVMSTGDELVDVAGALPAGQIRDVNGPMLRALLEESGFVAVDLGVVRDDVDAVRQRFEAGLETCDAVISTGGVSVGDVDFVKTAIAQICGPRARSVQVAMRPGKPFTFATTDAATPLFGLAGNPVSTLVGFEMFVRPALRLLAGHPDPDRPVVAMVLDEPVTRKPDGKLHLIHARARWGDDGRVHVTEVLRQGSHLLSAIADADALLMVPDGTGLASGEDVRGVLLRPGGAAGAGREG